MDNDERILKILESMDKRLDDIERHQARTDTTLDALKAGQDDIRENIDDVRENMATKADLKDLGAKIDATKAEVDKIKRAQRPRHAD